MFFGKRKNIEAETQELMKQVKNQLEKVSENLEEEQKVQQQVFQTLEGCPCGSGKKYKQCCGR